MSHAASRLTLWPSRSSCRTARRTTADLSRCATVIETQVCKGLLGLDDAVQHDRNTVRNCHRRPVRPDAARQTAILRPQVGLGAGCTARAASTKAERNDGLPLRGRTATCSCQHFACCPDTPPTPTPSDPASGSDPCPSPSPPRSPPPSDGANTGNRVHGSAPPRRGARHGPRHLGVELVDLVFQRPPDGATAPPEGSAGATPPSPKGLLATQPTCRAADPRIESGAGSWPSAPAPAGLAPPLSQRHAASACLPKPPGTSSVATEASLMLAPSSTLAIRLASRLRSLHQTSAVANPFAQFALRTVGNENWVATGHA